MTAASIVRALRRDAGLSLRSLAARAETSHSTLSAYEAGRVVPNFDTLERIAEAAGLNVDVTLTRRVANDRDRAAEIVDVLEVADQFPVRRRRDLDLPVFGRA